MGGMALNPMMGTTTGLSWTFTNGIFGICFLLVLHITLTLWKNRQRILQLREDYLTLIHTLPMSLGMASTMPICVVVGSLVKSHLSVAYVLGVMIGIMVSGAISFPFAHDIAGVNGVVAGAMGGLMGVMIGTMIPPTGFYVLSTLLTALFAVNWVVMRRRVYIYLQTANARQQTNNRVTTEIS